MTTPPPSILYRGMTWNPMRHGGIQTISETTRANYVVKPQIDGKLWDVHYGFTDMPGKPNVKIGTYHDEDIGRVAAERHDYIFWSSTIRRDSKTPVFIGSGDGQNLVQNIPSFEREEITDMLVEHTDTRDGAQFSQQASFFLSQKTGLKQEKNGSFTLTLSLSGSAIPQWLFESQPGTDLLMGAVQTGSAQSDDWQERGINAVKRAFALPADPSFQKWMRYRYDRWKLISSSMIDGTSEDVENAASETLKRLLACPSRKILARDRDAIEKLEKIDREFYIDLSKGYGVVGTGEE